jgi:hypothetical protein
MTTYPTVWTPKPDPHGHTTYTRIGGCLGTAFCDYCGQPMPTRHDARQRLARLIQHLRKRERRVSA